MAAGAVRRVEWLCVFSGGDDIVGGTRNGFDNIRTNISKWSVISLSFISQSLSLLVSPPSSAMLAFSRFSFSLLHILFRCRIFLQDGIATLKLKYEKYQTKRNCWSHLKFNDCEFFSSEKKAINDTEKKKKIIE